MYLCRYLGSNEGMQMQYNEWWMMSSKIKLINSFKPTHTVPQCHSSTPITILLHSTIYIYNSAPCRLSSHIHTVTPPINNSTPSIQNATPHLNTATPCIYTVTSPIHPMPHVPSITLPQLPFTLHISHSSHALYHNYNPHCHPYNYYTEHFNALLRPHSLPPSYPHSTVFDICQIIAFSKPGLSEYF